MPDKENPNAQEEENRQQEQENQEADTDTAETAETEQEEGGQEEEAETPPSQAEPEHSHARHLPAEKEIYRETKRIARKYRRFRENNSLSGKDKRDEKSAEIEQDEDTVARNSHTEEELRKAAAKMSGKHKQRREELADKIKRETKEARENLSQARKDIAEAEMAEPILDLHSEVETTLRNVTQRKEDFQTVAGYAGVLQFVKRAEKTRKSFPEGRSLPRVQERLQELDTALGELRGAVNGLEAGLKPEVKKSAEKLVDRRERAAQITQALNRKYRSSSPLVRLIRKAQNLESPTVPNRSKSTMGEDAASFIDEHVTGSATDLLDDSLSLKFGDGDNRSSLVGAIKTALLALFKKKSVSEAAKENPKSMVFFDFIAPLLKIYLYCTNIKKFMKSQGTSEDEEKGMTEDIVSGAVDTTISSAEAVLSALDTFGVLKEIPMIGSLLGLMSNALSVVIQARRWHRQAKHRDAAAAQKAKLKEEMAKKRLKYAGKGITDAEGKELFGFMGVQLDQKKGVSEIHVVKNKDVAGKKGTPDPRVSSYTTTAEKQQASLETAAGAGTNIYTAMAALKQKKIEGTMSEDEQKKYYQMKTLKMLQEYRELKEAKYVSEKRIRQGQVELVHTGIDIAKNILNLFPGITEVIASALGIVNTVSKYAHKGFTALMQKGRDKGWWGDGTKTTAAKAAKRGGMASDIHKQMLFVAQYMNPEDQAPQKGTFAPLEGEISSTVEKRMDYLENITGDLSYKFHEMNMVKTKAELLEKMESAFSTGG